MRDFNTLIAKWESELKKFVSIDPGYELGVFQRRNIVYRALPDEIKKAVDSEVAKGQLKLYEDFMGYIRTLANNYRYRSAAPPKPLSATMGMVGTAPGEAAAD